METDRPLSLQVSLWATVLSLPLGVFVAYALARWRFRGREVLNGLVYLPLILPPRPAAGDTHAWHLYVLRLADGSIKDARVNTHKVAASTLKW